MRFSCRANIPTLSVFSFLSLSLLLDLALASAGAMAGLCLAFFSMSVTLIRSTAEGRKSRP